MIELEGVKLTTELIKLTPELAQNFLENQVKNRRKSEGNIDALAGDIEDGKYEVTGQGIITDEFGRMVNGQHTCNAVIRAGIPVVTLLISGVKESAFDKIDTGKPRSGSDVLGIDEEKFVRTLTPCVSLLCKHDKGVLCSRNHYRVQPHQHRATLAAHPLARVGAEVGRNCAPITGFPGIIAFLWTVAAEKHGEDTANEFFLPLGTGEGLRVASPILALRNRMIRGKSRSTKVEQHVMLATAIKCWNAWISGNSVLIASFRDTEEFPEIL